MADVTAVVRARVGAARLVLASLPARSDSHTASSSIQRDALVYVLQTQGKSLHIAERADLITSVAEVPWADGDLAKVLEALKDSGSQPVAAKKKEGQTCTNFLMYLSETEWDRIPRLHQHAIGELFIDVLVHRCWQTHPSESSKKWVTSCILAASLEPAEVSTCPAEAKSDLLTWLSKRWKGTVRRLKTQFEDRVEYLPEPDELRARYPRLYEVALAGVGGKFTGSSHLVIQ